MSVGKMLKLADAIVTIGVDDKDYQEKMKSVGNLDKLAGGISGVAAHLTAFGAAANGAFLYAANQAGKHASQLTRIEMIYGDLEDAQLQWMDGYMKATRRGRVATTQMASTFGAFTKGLGFTDKSATYLSRTLMELTGDFQTFTGISTDEAMQRMISAMSGSGEVLDRFGINIKEAALNAKLLEIGFKSISQGATEQQKSIARLLLIEKALKDMGAEAFDKYADTYPKALAITKMAIDDMVEAIGKALLPRITTILKRGYEVIRMLENWARRNPGLVRTMSILATTITGVGLALAGMVVMIHTVSTAISAYAKVLGFLRIEMVKTFIASVTAMGPMGILIVGLTAALAALAAAFVYVASQSDEAGRTIRQSFANIVGSWDAGQVEMMLDSILLIMAAFWQKIMYMVANWKLGTAFNMLKDLTKLITKGMQLLMHVIAGGLNRLRAEILKSMGPVLGTMLGLVGPGNIDADAINLELTKFRDQLIGGLDKTEVAAKAKLKEFYDAIQQQNEIEAEKIRIELNHERAKLGLDPIEDTNMDDVIDEAGLNKDLAKAMGAPSPLGAAEFRSVSGQQQAFKNQQAQMEYMRSIAETNEQQVEKLDSINDAIRMRPHYAGGV